MELISMARHNSSGEREILSSHGLSILNGSRLKLIKILYDKWHYETLYSKNTFNNIIL